MAALYDTIGIDYARLRQPDPRIVAVIEAALGDARTVLNVGAGSGSYEPVDRAVTALEPSQKMIDQRPAGAAPVIQGTAETLPFADNSFDAAMAVLTVHHWSDKAKGLAEMRRVSRGPVVILTFDPDFEAFWLADYVPELFETDREIMPSLRSYSAVLGPVEITPVAIPHDCLDGFLCAYWRRPAAYLDPRVRAAISLFWKLGDRDSAWKQLETDLKSGEWERRYGALLAQDRCDFGYRLVCSA